MGPPATIGGPRPLSGHERALPLKVKPRNMLIQLGEWSRLGFFTRTRTGQSARDCPASQQMVSSEPQDTHASHAAPQSPTLACALSPSGQQWTWQTARKHTTDPHRLMRAEFPDLHRLYPDRN